MRVSPYSFFFKNVLDGILKILWAQLIYHPLIITTEIACIISHLKVKKNIYYKILKKIKHSFFKYLLPSAGISTVKVSTDDIFFIILCVNISCNKENIIIPKMLVLFNNKCN